MPQETKKLVSVLATSTSPTENQEAELKQVSCIQYLITFQDTMNALLDLESEVNIISLEFAQKLGLKIKNTNVSA